MPRLNGKKWAEPVCTVIIDKNLASNQTLMRKLKKVRRQFNQAVPFKVKLKINTEPEFPSITHAINYARDQNAVLTLYKQGETWGLGTRVANTAFNASQGSTAVHSAVVRINDIRLQQVSGGDLNYITNLIFHEVGHAFGLDHADPKTEKFSIMRIGKFFGGKRLGLSKGDKKALRSIYGKKK